MRRAFGCLALLTMLGAATEAHHSVLGFDAGHPLTLRGVVTSVLWNNPHTYIALTVQTGAQRGRRWLIESESPVALQRLGWTRASIRAGDRIVSVGAPDRRGERIMRCQTVAVAGLASLPCYPATTQ